MAQLIRYLWTAVFLYIWIVPGWAEEPASMRPLQRSDLQRSLVGEVSVLRDPTGKLGIEDVSAPTIQASFSPVARGIAYGFTRDVLWLRITLQREVDSPESWRLEATNSVIDDFQFYVPDVDHGYVLASRSGDRLPFANRALPYRHPLFAVVLPDTQQRVFYLRVESATALNFALQLWQPEELRKAGQKELLIIGLVLGLIGAIALLNALTWMVMRETKYLFFTIMGFYVFETLVTFLGFSAQYLFPKNPMFVDTLHNINVCFMPACLMLFMSQTLEIKQHYPSLDRWMFRGALACLIAALSAWAGYFSFVGPLLHVGLFFSVAMIARAAWGAYRRGLPGSISFLAGTLCFLLPIMLALLRSLGIFAPAQVWQEGVWMLNISMFSILMHLGLLRDILAVREKQVLAESAGKHSSNLVAQERQLRDEQTIFFSFVAHELRNPLGVIVSGLTNLRIGLSDAGGEILERLARISAAAERMRDLIDRHLRMQRLSNADFEPDFTDCSPQFPALQALELIGESHAGRAIEYASANDLPPLVAMDAELMTLALVNLLDNAIKYSPSGASVRLVVRQDMDQAGAPIVYVVSDHGPGIPPDQREHLFEVFVRKPGNNKAGFGIGLALVANIARHHGGSIRYDSSAESGATFLLSLPSTQVHAEANP